MLLCERRGQKATLGECSHRVRKLDWQHDPTLIQIRLLTIRECGMRRKLFVSQPRSSLEHRLKGLSSRRRIC